MKKLRRHWLWLVGLVLVVALVVVGNVVWPEQINNRLIGIVAAIAAGCWIAARIHRKKFLTQYLFFIRYPILLGCALVLGPVLAPANAGAMLRNLFVLTPVGIGIVTLYACFCGWAIVYTGLLIWYSAPIQNKLCYDRDRNDAVLARRKSVPQPPPDLMTMRSSAFSLLLVVPLAWQLIRLTDGGAIPSVLAVVVGVMAAVGLHALAQKFTDPAVKKLLQAAASARDAAAHLAMPLVAHFIAPEVPAPDPKVALPDTVRARVKGASFDILHLRAKFFGLFSVAVYLLVALGRRQDSVPALAYLLAVFLVLIWMLGWLAFLCDRTRVPIIAMLLALLAVWNIVLPSGHVYPVSSWRQPAAPDARAVLNKFAADRDGTLVVVAASGGGITAAYWTAVVLRGVSESFPAGEFDFNRHVALVSSVSGGSVGGMYYVDAFAPGRPPDGPALDAMVKAAGTSSLAATAWGIAYPDLARLVLGRLLGYRDRGWAQEQRWGESLAHPGRTLGDWAADVAAAQRPLQLFNATLQETGGRLILAAANLPGNDGFKRNNFIELFRHKDVAVVTAARLSATFPYVSPQASPAIAGDDAQRAFHSVDGGYYDNSGIVSALDIVKDWLDSDQYNGKLRKIALIEIRAGGPEANPKVDADNLVNSVGSPLKTLFNVRSTSQLARNQFELDLVSQLWNSSGKFKFDHFVFGLGGDTPLSWHLTATDKAKIENHWKEPPLDFESENLVQIVAMQKKNMANLEALRCFLLDQ